VSPVTAISWSTFRLALDHGPGMVMVDDPNASPPQVVGKLGQLNPKIAPAAGI
jgi:hypothetical protein